MYEKLIRLRRKQLDIEFHKAWLLRRYNDGHVNEKHYNSKIVYFNNQLADLEKEISITKVTNIIENI